MLTRSPMKRTRPGPSITPNTRATLISRSDGWCEAQLSGCEGRATDACHRISRKAGGRVGDEHESLANLWHGCRPCHRWATNRQAEAYDLGLALKDWQVPELEPIARRGQWVLLANDGSWREVCS
jgi:hypothetical protein